MAILVPIGEFVAYLELQADASHDYKAHAGYIMGTTGQTLTEDLLKKYSTYQTDYSPATYVSKGKKWLGRRCYDCNGLAEGCYKDKTGIDINTKARFNYAQWCSIKGSNMAEMPRVPGIAVFMHSSKRGYITHVGFLWKPVKAGHPEGDWYVIEARGVDYGVVVTLLSKRGWNRWGAMTKYYDYGNSLDTGKMQYIFGGRVLKVGCSGDDVQALQQTLISLGYSCGSYGADGEFGSDTHAAVCAYQEDSGLSVDGIVGKNTYTALTKRLEDDSEPDNTAEATVEGDSKVAVYGGQAFIRTAPSVDTGLKLGIAHEGDILIATGNKSSNGWHEVRYGSGTGWISGAYAMVVV